MEKLIPILIVAGMLALMGVLWYCARRAEQKRTEVWKQKADEMGFDFAAAPGTGILGRFPGFHLLSQGHSKSVRNVLTGKASGLEVTIFDYSYVTGGGKHQRRWTQTVIAFEFDDTVLPNFSLRPESVFHKIGQWFGYHDISFENYPRFSNSYLLRGEDEGAVRQHFADHVLEYYEDSPGVCTEASGGRLVYYRTSTRIAPDDVRSFMEEGFRVLALFRPPAEGVKS
jgi:hypothetical protein